MPIGCPRSLLKAAFFSSLRCKTVVDLEVFFVSSRSLGSRLANVFIYSFLVLVVLTMTLPFINIVAVSFSSETAVLQGAVTFWPVGFTVNTYVRIFRESQLIRALGNTVVLTVVGTVINMVCTVCAAYPLSKPWLKGRGVLLGIITFTMLFGAGIIPSYILIKNLNLLETFWSLWLPGAISTKNMIILNNFLQSIPNSNEEIAQIDGASPLRILVQIVLPLSMASIATIALFYAVGWWNSYFSNMLYINTPRLTTLQVQLRELLNLRDTDIFSIVQTDERLRMAEESIKASSIVIATVPILLVYPFLQRYFVKGVMIGSIKG